MSIALGAVNRSIDPARSTGPISATDIRLDAYAHRHMMAPLVYRDLVTNVVFLGAPSTGKTTLCEYLAGRYDTCCMPEYGREYWEAHQTKRRLTLDQLVEIAEGHLTREDAALERANTYLFTDTNAITTHMFSMDYHGESRPRLADLADKAASRYDLVLLCGDDIPYDDTWDRSGAQHRAAFHRRITADLLARCIPFITLRGSLAC